MKYIFTFKLTSKKNAKVHTFCGTWNEFEDKYTNVILTTIPEEL